jgi:hypothetical protein
VRLPVSKAHLKFLDGRQIQLVVLVITVMDHTLRYPQVQKIQQFQALEKMNY